MIFELKSEDKNKDKNNKSYIEKWQAKNVKNKC